MKLRDLSALLTILLMAAGSAAAATAAPGVSPPLAVKVMVVNMFRLEAAPWLKALKISREIAVPGLSSDYPLVRCTADAVCQMTTAMGHANAAASIMALAYSGLFDLRKTYFLIAGIAGIDPDRGTVGSAAWARFAVDADLVHEVDTRDLPKEWTDGHFGIQTMSPDRKPSFGYGTEVFRLNEALLQRALVLSKGVTLEDNDAVRVYRAHYAVAPANQPPQVIQCDTASGDTWWAGPHLEEHMRRWVRLLTDNQGVYCTTQQEDNATLAALARASQSGLVDAQRVAILRTGSDFDRPYSGQGTLESLHTQLMMPGAANIACDNLVEAGKPLVDAIAGNWSQWQAGVPAN
jgi:purine nucleoside permease